MRKEWEEGEKSGGVSGASILRVSSSLIRLGISFSALAIGARPCPAVAGKDSAAGAGLGEASG